MKKDCYSNLFALFFFKPTESPDIVTDAEVATNKLSDIFLPKLMQHKDRQHSIFWSN